MLDKLGHLFLSLHTFNASFLSLINHFVKKLFFKRSYNAENYINLKDFSFSNFNSLIEVRDFDLEGFDNELAKYLLDNWLNHNFNILNSGWIKFDLETEAPGFLGIKNESNSHPSTNYLEPTFLSQIEGFETFEKEIFSESYSPINWNKDYKSGFIWDRNKKSSEQSDFVNLAHGVDIKMPWELSRLNHLPLLAVLSTKFPEKKDLIQKEITSIISDWIVNNPYGYGINWSNAMEVGIRLVNILVSLDILNQLKTSFSDSFKTLLEYSIYEHSKFIIEHSEFKEGFTNNHYYANISALLTAGAYFQKSQSGKILCSIGMQEVHIESQKQFLKDGANFESSTHYHRLTTEMLLWNIYFIRKIKSVNSIESAPNWNNYQGTNSNDSELLTELENIAARALKFSFSIFKTRNQITSVGDQDSGRYLKFGLSGEFLNFGELKKLDYQFKLGDYQIDDSTRWWMENDLDHGGLLHFGKKIYFEPILENSDNFCIEKGISKSLIPNQNIDLKKVPVQNFSYSKGKLKYSKESIIKFNCTSSDFLNELEIHAYQDFGLYILKSNNFFLSITASNNHLPKYWSHGKNDKLSFELNVNGENIISDPGSFNYTADYQSRNKFRSTKSHSTISVQDEEQNRWPKGKNSVFNLYNESRCTLIEKQNNILKFECRYRNILHHRTFKIERDQLIIFDECNKPFEVNLNRNQIISKSYGSWTIN